MSDDVTTEATTESTETTATTVDTEKSWTISLAPEVRELPTFSKFKNVNDLATSYLNLEKTLGKEKLPLPKDDKDQAGWDMVYNRLGRPEAADKYEIKMQLAEGLNANEEHIKGLKSQAHKLGLSSKQLQGMIDYWTDLENGALKQRQDSSADAKNQAELGLRKRYGSAFEQTKTNVEAVIKNLVDKDDQAEFLEAAKNNPKLFNALANISKNFSEDTLKGSSKGFAMAPEEAQREYLSILGDSKHPFNIGHHPEHDLAVEKMHNLMLMMNPELAKASE